MTFYIKTDNTSSGVELSLLDSAGAGVNIIGATSIRFHLINAYGQLLVDDNMTVIQSNPAVVRYAWQNGDIPKPGVHRAEVEVTYSDGTIQSFPNLGYTIVEVERKLA